MISIELLKYLTRHLPPGKNNHTPMHLPRTFSVYIETSQKSHKNILPEFSLLYIFLVRFKAKISHLFYIFEDARNVSRTMAFQEFCIYWLSICCSGKFSENISSATGIGLIYFSPVLHFI